MRPTPYVGVTGFMQHSEVTAGVAAFFSTNTKQDHRRLMIGVLCDSEILAGQINKWPTRYPNWYGIESLFSPLRPALNLIHYATDDKKTLADQLARLVSLGGRYLNGFQLNIRWPDPQTIRLPEGMRVVLQLGYRALDEMENDPKATAKRLDDYHGIITDILVDASGIAVAKKYVETIATRHSNLGIGVAGGLCADALTSLQSLVDVFPDLSINAEGRLRSPDDQLNVQAMQDYISSANRLLK